MIVAILDTNIFDKLEISADVCDLICNAIKEKRLAVLVTRAVAEELGRSKFNGIPDLFPYTYIGNTVAMADIMCAGDSLGDGEVFLQHKGESNKVNDALIADAAATKADWLVTQDKRLRSKLQSIKTGCVAMDFENFRVEVNGLNSIIIAGKIDA